MTKRQPDPPRDDPEQSKRFIEAAVAAGEAEPGEFERAFQKVVRKPVIERRRPPKKILICPNAGPSRGTKRFPVMSNICEKCISGIFGQLAEIRA